MTTEALALILAALSFLWSVIQAIQQRQNGYARKEDLKRLDEENLRLRDRGHVIANALSAMEGKVTALEGINRRRNEGKP